MVSWPPYLELLKTVQRVFVPKSRSHYFTPTHPPSPPQVCTLVGNWTVQQPLYRANKNQPSLRQQLKKRHRSTANFIYDSPHKKKSEKKTHARIKCLHHLSDGLDDHNLELVRDLVHEGRDLLHQAVHRSFRSRLEQSSDGQRGDRP